MTPDNNIAFKYLDNSKLIGLLQQLPKNTVVAPNDVGNLGIYKKQGDDFEFIGFIDFLLEGEIEYS